MVLQVVVQIHHELRNLYPDELQKAGNALLQNHIHNLYYHSYISSIQKYENRIYFNNEHPCVLQSTNKGLISLSMDSNKVFSNVYNQCPYTAEWINRLEKLGAGEILLTSMDKDGTKHGFDLELLKKASKELSIPVIASGGVGKLSHFKDGAIVGKANALLAASVFHFGEVSIQEVKDYLMEAGISVRID